MKKTVGIIFSVLLVAAGCSQARDSGQTAVPSQNIATKGVIETVDIQPAAQNGEWLMYGNGAVIRVVAKNMQNVEIKYSSTAASGQSLGEAVSLSSQPDTWALPLPKGIVATAMWAEGRDVNGAVIKSYDLGSVGYEQPNTYRSPQNKFSIEYGKDFGFNTDYNKVKTLGYIPVCESTMAACVFYTGDTYQGTNFEAAGVSINLLKNLNTEAKCYNFDSATNEAQTDAGIFTINGVQFRSATGGGGAAGHFSKVQVYRSFYDNRCYELSQKVVSTNIGVYEPGAVQEFNEDEAWQKLWNVVQSFEFVSPAGSLPKAGTSVTVTGTTVCLPHKITKPDQPQTMECAIGLKESKTGVHYGLRNTGLYDVYDVNASIEVTGTFQLDSNSKYDIVGSIDAQNIKIR